MATQYFIRTRDGKVQGPFAVASIQAWIASGKVREDMHFSADGANWVAGHDCPELFGADLVEEIPEEPAARAPAPVSSRGGRLSSRASRSGGYAAPARHYEEEEEEEDDDAPVRGSRRRGGRYNGPKQTNSMALASMILGLLFVWVLALPFGYSARKQIRNSQGREDGEGMATVGIVLGWIGAVCSVIWIILIIIAAKEVAENPYYYGN